MGLSDGERGADGRTDGKCIRENTGLLEYMDKRGTRKPPPTAQALPVAILVRVSTARQETGRQVSEFRAHADAKGWNVVEVCEEVGVSGRAKETERHGLQAVEEMARAGQIKKVLEEHRDIVKLLKAGYSIRKTARLATPQGREPERETEGGFHGATDRCGHEG